MTYLDTELKTTLIFAVLGIIMGYVSFLVNHTAGAALLTVVVFAAGVFGIAKVLKIKEERKWWSTMGLVYFLMWLIVWTVFYNVFLL